MEQIIRELIQKNNPHTPLEYDRAIREAIQHVALLGLWRSGFFEYAAFYGGTALRILHGLPRFSEDIDFSLLEKRHDFSLDRYLSSLKIELSGFGFHVEYTAGKKTGAIDSAFIKANTRAHLLQVTPDSSIANTIPPNQLVRVKLEVDIDPPADFETEALPVLEPIPFYVRAYSLPDLFAGKMHCVLFRKWKKRVKGRDWYDMVWFLKKNIPLNLSHLERRMRQSSDWIGNKKLDPGKFLRLYRDRVAQVDFSRAVTDVRPFIHEVRELEVWNTDFFLSISGRFRFC